MLLEDVRKLKVVARIEILKALLAAPELASAPTVTLGVGRRPTMMDGKEDFWLTARIRTPVRQPETEEAIGAVLSKLVGDDFDLRYTGPVFALRPYGFATGKTVPSKLTIGSSVSHIHTLGGTLGFFAKSQSDGTRGFVSANHVIANLGRAHPGERVVSPSQSKREIGKLVRFTELDGGGEKHTDAAFASLDELVKVDRSILPKGKKLSNTPAPLGESTRVMKLGARTRFTEGNVLTFDTDTFSTSGFFGLGEVKFDDQIEVESASREQIFATDGDSGSLVYNDRGRAVGMLFAATLGNGTYGNGLAYINPIASVLDELKVDLDVT